LKLQADRIDGVNVISGLTADNVSVNGVPHRQSILVPWQGSIDAWASGDVDALAAADFERIAEMNPELVIFGSGPRLRFPSSALLKPLIERRIGLETMDTSAACRTYNVLVAEGRRVVAALLVG
jgi:uncharacterized protein